jgi:ribonuclease PH
MAIKRAYQRAYDQLRPMRISYDVAGNAAASALFELGKTKVLCTVSLSGQVPLFLRGKNRWWLTASYALLPASTHSRVERDSSQKRQDRSIEIARLIGRSLRAVLNLDSMLSERTIHIDCDVVQADGGTRTACITAAAHVLYLAQQRWLAQGLIQEPLMRDELAAVSVGLRQDTALLDIDFAEDSSVQADFNFVLTRSGEVVELQGCGEKNPVSWKQIEEMKKLADKGVQELLTFLDQHMVVVVPSLSERLKTT